MIRMIEAKKDTIQEKLVQKKVICFGVGRRFDYFRKKNPKILITGIIDNYKSNNFLQIDNEWIPVWFPEEISCQIDKDTVIIITSMAIEEIVDQMDKIKKFEEVSCYAEVEIDNYIGLDDSQRLRIEKLIYKLAHRKYESILKETYREWNLISAIKKYQIWEYFSISDTAASKARIDIKNIIGNMGYEVVNMHCCRGTATTKGDDRLVKADWKYFFKKIPENAIVFMQVPAPAEMGFSKDMMLYMKENKHIHFISLIHDIDILRSLNSSQMRQEEIKFIEEISDFLIVHNDVMKKYYEKLGFKENRIISLEIFDYLHDEAENDKIFDKTIIFAGNLSREKSPFLDQIGKLLSLNIYLYGPNFSHDILSKADNVRYCGSFSAELLPQKFDRGFGLVWDGSSLETCAGGTGDYLRYNNPHKMSLYFSAGLPVIIWRGAAQAKFVREKQAGIVVDSLYDIRDILDEMDEDRYFALTENAKKLSRLLKDGYYTRMAVQQIEKAIENG